MRIIRTTAILGWMILLVGCMAFQQGNGSFPVDAPNVRIPISRLISHSPLPGDDPLPLFVGAKWVYRNATADHAPVAHPASLRATEVLANVHCVDEETLTAWECYVVEDITYPDRGTTSYVHRATTGLMTFHRMLRDPASEFPGFASLKYPLLSKTYWVYNVPTTVRSAGSPSDSSVPIWERATGCSGNLGFMTTSDGECNAGSGTVYLGMVYDRETIAIPAQITTLQGTHDSIFPGAWKAEFYDGIDRYPDYYWWTESPHYAWYAPGIGVVKHVLNSSVFNLLQFVLPTEVLGLSESSPSNPKVLVGGLVVVQLRGTNPSVAGSEQWRLVGNSGQESGGILEATEEREFYSDIRATDGAPLVSGTYVFRFQARASGHVTLQFQRQDYSGSSVINEITYFVQVDE